MYNTEYKTTVWPLVITNNYSMVNVITWRTKIQIVYLSVGALYCRPVVFDRCATNVLEMFLVNLKIFYQSVYLPVILLIINDDQQIINLD